MKKLETTIILNAMAERHVTDIMTDRQASTLQSLCDQGFCRIARKERVKPNMVIVEYKGPTKEQLDKALAASSDVDDETETETDTASE